jgi:pilus assembly protein CpaE
MTGALVSTEVTIVGSNTNELEDLLRSNGIQAASVEVTELLQLARPAAKPPKVIVLDMRGHAAFPPAMAQLKGEHPTTGIVIVAGTQDPALMLEAIRAGVNEWVAEPLKPADLVAAVRRITGHAPAASRGDLFVVMGAKGGVGATTVAVNLASTLASTAKSSTLMIDLHPSGGDAALLLGAEPKFSLLDALDNTHRLDQAFFKGIVVHTAAGVDLLAAPEHAAPPAIDPRRLRAVIEFAVRAYRYVVIDSSRSDRLVEETFDLANHLVIVATQELAAIRHGTRIAADLRQRYGADRIQVVLNRYDSGADISSEDLERAFKSRIVHRFPSNYRLASEAVNKGRPLVVDNHTKLAGSFAAHARALAGVSKRDAAGERSGGLLGKLTGRR